LEYKNEAGGKNRGLGGAVPARKNNLYQKRLTTLGKPLFCYAFRKRDGHALALY
jgi:hypothetical protein